MAGMAQARQAQVAGSSDKKEHRQQQVIMNGPLGRVVVRQSLPVDEDDDDDHEKDGVPPEILEMIRMTEAMHRRATGGMGPFGAVRGPRQLRISKADDKKDE